MGQVLEATGHPADALREFEKGLEMDPSDAVAKAAAVRLRANAPRKHSRSEEFLRRGPRGRIKIIAWKMKSKFYARFARRKRGP